MSDTADPVRAQVETALRQAVELARTTPCDLLRAARRTVGETVGLVRTVVNLTVDGLFGWDVGPVGPRIDDADMSPAPTAATSTPSPAAVDQPVAGDAGVDAVDLAIPGYQDLAASHIVARLDRLSPDELTAIRHFELAHRGRRTVIGKIDQLLAR